MVKQTDTPAGQSELAPLGQYYEGMPWNPVEKVIMERRSTRRYKKEPLPDGMIRRILEAARFAPSTGNQQPWKFIVIKSPEIIAEMEKDALWFTRLLVSLYGYTSFKGLRRWLTKILAKSTVMRFMSNMFHPVPYFVYTVAAQDKTTYFHNAPVMILLLEDQRGVSTPSVDIGVAGEHMVLAAHSMGAAACWVGFIKLITYFPKWKKKFGIKYPYKLRESIVFGWPSPKADGIVPREVQTVQWFDGGMDDLPRLERQGE
jgi:nitroreductase